jgi:hypothetical protein
MRYDLKSCQVGPTNTAQGCCRRLRGSHLDGHTEANGRATALLADAVQNQAYVLAYIDAFMILGYAVIGALLLILLLRKPPPGTLFRPA